MNEFQKKRKHIGKQALGLKNIEYVSTFLFGKLRSQIQQEVSTAGKMDASTDEINDFIQRHFQYQQLLLSHQLHPFNQIFSGRDNPPKRKQKVPQSEVVRLQTFQGTCSQCNKKGHKIAEFRTKNERLPHNFNKTDNKSNTKDPSTTKSWYAVNVDTLANPHGIADTKTTLHPPTEALPIEKQNTD